jgi:hypothetical protein
MKQTRNYIARILTIALAGLAFGEGPNPVALRSIFMLNPEVLSLGIGIVIGSNGTIEDRRHYFVPDFYDHTLIVIFPAGCEEPDKAFCGFDRGQIFWENFTDEQVSVDIIAEFQRNRKAFQRYWRSNDTDRLDNPVSGFTSIQDHGATLWQLGSQFMRKVSANSLLKPTLGLTLAPLYIRNNSFLENFDRIIGLPSLSWSYTYNYANLGKITEKLTNSKSTPTEI